MESKIITTTKIWEIMPFIVMVMMEGVTIALTIFAKTELNNGMSPFVFIVYTNALATIILFPSSFLLHNNNGGRKEPTPPFTFSLFMRFLLLGFTRITMTQSFSFLGLSYSSPILVCAMGLLIPTFNFLLSLIFRETELNLRSSGFQVQVIGVLISIMGGLEAELFKGPLIRPTTSSSDDKLQFTNNNIKKPLFVFSSVPEFWVLGGLLLASASFSVALWNFIQKKTIKEYPEPTKGVAYYSMIGTMLSAIVAWIVERDDANAWKLNHHMQLTLIILTALFGGVIRPNIQIWFTRMKGPSYVPLFKPFGIAFATTFGVCIFPNSLHYGSVIGAAIIGLGYYTIIWGQMKEEEKRFAERSDYLDNKIPLLQEKMEEV